MESIIRDVIMEDFLIKNSLVTISMALSRADQLVLQLLKIFDDWTYKMDQGVQIDVIYTDFEKAFWQITPSRIN